MSLPDLQTSLTQLEHKDFQAAVEGLEQKVTALPAHLGAQVLLAHAYEAQKRWEDALEAWANAHFLMPNSPIAKAGKRRVLRRMDGITGDDQQLPVAETLPSLSPTPTETSSEDEAEDSPEETNDPPPEDDFGLAQLRRQAEREARQGGARPGLADEPPSPPAPDDASEESSSTPEEQIEHLDDGEEADDLDRLINKLQSARIDPDPEAQMSAPPPGPEDSDDPSAGDEEEHDPAEEVVSETLAKIHEGQNDYEKAAHIYAQLAEQEPGRADEFREKAAEMREKADGADEDT